ncbi:MAG: hypothetical protein MUP67_08660 [Acidimicrobiia bacterium]|nr:hypothetical protein [Acidimicrobiia bacterium]
MKLSAIDEGRHLPGTDALWGESWYHDFAASDGSYGGYLRLGLYPNQEIAWYWVYLVRKGRSLVLIRDHAVPGPTAMEGPIEVASDRVSGTWTPEDPLRKYRITTEGTGIELADPADAFHDEQGPEVAVSIDLTWEGVAAPFPYTATTRFEQSARVSGTVTIGDERIEVSCPGQRDHSWGVRDWWAFPWVWCSGRLDDGTWWHTARSVAPKVEIFQTGYVITPDMTLQPVEQIGVDYELDIEELPVRGTLAIGELALSWTAEMHAPALLVSPEGKRSRFPRAVCRFETADGRAGRGWIEFNFPEDVPHLGRP